ncbi:MAG: tRNA threonylcarbamoyladenosine dehydratase [Draconibacterium sp.]|nr:MAG: tRNA threonylcarbamoyladenosine dehydratase [Draconibacterium sp.]PIF06452.1 MAG: tRNA threonylcarbamoyladenosine dehydratase [Draconibacterium sp.]
MHWLDRTELLLGKDRLNRLKNAHVLVVGLGGVGAYVAEQLCRAGVGNLTIVDGDAVEATNRNRQLPALISNTGQLKTAVLKRRFLDINPDINIVIVNEFIRDEKTISLLKSQPFDYVVDAIDTLSPKVFLIYYAVQLGLRVVSSMGTGGKLNPQQTQIADISKTHGCKLAKAVRKRLTRKGVKSGVKVVFSPEKVNENSICKEEGQNKKSTVGTISYMPPIFGCFVASVVINDLISE